MSQKKIIKVQSGSEKAENEENSVDEVIEDEQSPDNEQAKAEQVAVDDQMKELEAKLEAAGQESKENYDRLLRVSAEFENYKKRSIREMEDFRKFANQSLLKEMLSVVDNLELAMNSAADRENGGQGLLEGLNMMHKEILRVFEKFDVKPISAEGQMFDPTFHEAVMQEETDELPENSVVHEMQKGYLIHDRLLRPSMVVVAKPRSNKDDQESEKRK